MMFTFFTCSSKVYEVSTFCRVPYSTGVKKIEMAKGGCLLVGRIRDTVSENPDGQSIPPASCSKERHPVNPEEPS